MTTVDTADRCMCAGPCAVRLKARMNHVPVIMHFDWLCNSAILSLLHSLTDLITTGNLGAFLRHAQGEPLPFFEVYRRHQTPAVTQTSMRHYFQEN